jgi:DNA-binding response OmpR family regulator
MAESEKSGTIFAARLNSGHGPTQGMSTKRILIIHEDRLLTNLYREKLEASGFTVDTVRSLEQVPKHMETKRPDLVLVDLVLREGGTNEFIKTLRQDASTLELPVLVLPSNLTALASESMQAGATKIISNSANPLGTILDTAKVSVGLPGLGSALDAPLFQADESWLSMVLATAPEALNQMRHCLPGLVSQPPDLGALRMFWTLMHNFADRAAMLQAKALHRVAGAADVLLADVNEMPEQLNASTLRTLGQVIDFLGVLADPANLSRTEEPSTARIVVVDDEASAREAISSAMQMAGLRNEEAATPSEALQKLDGKEADLIFLDVGLPEMNGFELCTRIRGLEEHKRTPIVFLTGMATFANKAQASLSGGNDFVGKPFNLPELGVKALTWVLKHQLNLA